MGSQWQGHLGNNGVVEVTITAARIKRAARQAELASGTGATGYTILKFRSSPIARLVEHHDIGPEEFWAATDIDFAFHAIAGAIGDRKSVV